MENENMREQRIKIFKEELDIKGSSPYPRTHKRSLERATHTYNTENKSDFYLDFRETSLEGIDEPGSFYEAKDHETYYELVRVGEYISDLKIEVLIKADKFIKLKKEGKLKAFFKKVSGINSESPEDVNKLIYSKNKIVIMFNKIFNTDYKLKKIITPSGEESIRIIGGLKNQYELFN